MNNFSFHYLSLTLVFGVFFYDYLGESLGLTFVDELLMVVLLLYGAVKNTNIHSPEFKWITFYFVFYLIYSLCFGVACWQAVLTDAIIYLKPFVGFYVAWKTGMMLSASAKKKLKRIVILITVTTLISCVISYSFVVYKFMGHPSRLATLFQVLGVIYFYCSNKNKRSLLITMIIFSCSMLSLRSKSYAFVAAAIYLFYYLDARKLERVRLTTIISLLLCCSIVFIVAWEKFQFYFIQGSNSDLTESFARPALYQGALLILKDYFPFGSGFGSYACYASSVYYSPIYYKYGLNYVFGLSEDRGGFIADTFFPQIAQFGIVGVILFVVFFVKRYKNTIAYYKINKDSYIMKISLLILVFFIIESSVDSTFVHNRGMAMMLLWSMIINESKNKSIATNK